MKNNIGKNSFFCANPNEKHYNLNILNYSSTVNLEHTQNYHRNSNNFTSEIEKLIEMKISQKDSKISAESKELMRRINERLDTHEKKINALEFDNLPQMNNSNEKRRESTSIIQNDFTTTEIYKEEVDNDSYMYLSVSLSFTTLPLLCSYYYLIFFKPGIPLKKRFRYLLSIILSPIFMLPGIATPIIQLFSGYVVYIEAEESYSIRDKSTLPLLKLLTVLFFVFMVAREITQGINNFFCCYFEVKKKTHFFIAGCFLPPFLQISIAVFICFISFLLIASTDDAIELIQNFSALYVLLEFDNLMMSFIRLTKLNIFMLIIKKQLEEMRKIMNFKEIFSKHLIKTVLFENSLDVNYGQHHKYYKIIFIILRVTVILGLVIFTSLVYIYDVLVKETQELQDLPSQ